jgi:hypothetical protein
MPKSKIEREATKGVGMGYGEKALEESESRGIGDREGAPQSLINRYDGNNDGAIKSLSYYRSVKYV